MIEFFFPCSFLARSLHQLEELATPSLSHLLRFALCRTCFASPLLHLLRYAVQRVSHLAPSPADLQTTVVSQPLAGRAEKATSAPRTGGLSRSPESPHYTAMEKERESPVAAKCAEGAGTHSGPDGLSRIRDRRFGGGCDCFLCGWAI